MGEPIALEGELPPWAFFSQSPFDKLRAGSRD
jgi:hypothetical protein